MLAHAFGELQEVFPFFAAGCHDESFGDLVVGRVGFHPVINPLVPLTRHVVTENGVVMVLWVVASKVAEFGCPPGGIA